MAETKMIIDPFKTGAQYNRHRRRWELEEWAAEGVLADLEAGTWLDKFSDKEKADDYNYRKSQSLPLDICPDGVQVRMDALWRTAPKREFKDSPHKVLIEQLVNDADDEGTSLDALMQRVARLQYVSGCDVVTQTKALPKDAKLDTKADEQAAGLRPYFAVFTPLSRFDWQATASGRMVWARYCLGEAVREDETDKGPAVTRFLTVAPGVWRVWRVTMRDDHTKHIEIESEGTHALASPPIVKAYYRESSRRGETAVPLGLLTRPAVVARVLMNLTSQGQTDMLAAIPRIWATGVGEKEAPKTYGAGTFMYFQNEGAKLGILQGEYGHIEEKRRWVELLIGEILRLLKFRGGMAEITSGSGSGARYALERTDLENEMRTTAGALERWESEMIRQAVSLYTGKEIPPEKAAEEIKYSVTYSRDFVFEPVQVLLENLERWFEKSGFAADEAPEISREMLRQLANALMRAGTPGYDQAMEEIEAASMDGVSEPPDTQQKPVPEQTLTGQPVEPDGD